MFGVFKKHRILKLAGLFLGLFLLWYLVSPVIDIVKGQSVPLTEIVGSYAYGVDHWIDFYTTECGKMVSSGESIMFSYEYDKGTIHCTEYETDRSWDIKVLSTDSIYNCYDKTYLFKRE